jgi:alpha-beta hydrolase superfamily lysophospholipase
MEIRPRDVGLIALGFVMGGVFALLLTMTPTRPSTATSASVVVTGPFLARTSLPHPLTTITNGKWKFRPILVVPPNSLDLQSTLPPLYPAPHPSMDLIDTRYEPNIRLDDLK